MKYIRPNPRTKKVAYTTRNFEYTLLDRLRLFCVVQRPPWTLEHGLNEAVRAGIDLLESEANGRKHLRETERVPMGGYDDED